MTSGTLCQVYNNHTGSDIIRQVNLGNMQHDSGVHFFIVQVVELISVIGVKMKPSIMTLIGSRGLRLNAYPLEGTSV